jgi:tetratricopeptide (TPR) repeat protein
MSLDEELSGKTSELLETAGRVCEVCLDEEEKRNYFLSEGTGMELWERLKAEGFTPEELEEAKNELKRKDLLSIRKSENFLPYYYRFYGKLARITDYMEHRNEDLSPGHATITYTENNERVYIKEKLLRKEKDIEEATEIVEKALKRYKRYNEDREEAIQELLDRGLELETFRDMMELKGEMDSEEFDQALEKLVDKGFAEKKVEEIDRRRSVYFVSEWVERGDEKTRFFFSPEICREFLN